MQLLVLQPTGFCNLDCKYCYLPDRSNKARMGQRVLEAIGERIVGSAAFQPDTTVIWHAGEPLVLPPDWYRNATETIERRSGRALPRQSFQTNATAITDDWLAYLAQPNVTIGVSLDGPEDLHDRNRVDRKGRGTWKTTMKGIKRLRAAGVPFHTISVITEAALDRPREIARCLIDIGPKHIGLNIEEIDGINQTSTLFAAQAGDRVRRFVNDFADELEKDANPPKLRELETLNSMLNGARDGQIMRSQENAPGAILSVDTAGNISTYSPELLGIKSTRYSDFLFGNVNDISDVADVFLNKNFLRCQKAVAAGVALCKRTCGHFALCGGGAPANKFGETGRLDVSETQFCQTSVKTVLDTLMNRQLALHQSDEETGHD